MSYLETSEGSCYSSLYAATAGMGGGTQLLSSTVRDSARSAAEFAPWGGRGSSGLGGGSSHEAYSSATSASRERLSGAACTAAPGGGAGLLVEERTEVVTEEGTGRRVTETVRRALARHGAADIFRDAVESSGGSEQAATAAGGTEPAFTAEEMSAEEAEQRVRGLYRRLRGADHFRSLPALDRPADGSPGRWRRRRSPGQESESVAEYWQVRRPVPHFPAELQVPAIHSRLRARLAEIQDCLEEPLRGDLYKYVEFIGSSCLDPEDESVKRDMAEKVMKLLLQREATAGGASEATGLGEISHETSGAASQPNHVSAVTADSGWDGGRHQWPDQEPFRQRVPSPYSRERPGPPCSRDRSGSPSRQRPGSPSRQRPGSPSRQRPGSPSRQRPGSPSRQRPGSPGRLDPAAEQGERRTGEEEDRAIGAWRHQLTRSERRLQAGLAATGEGSEASEPAWQSHNYGRDPHDAHRTDTTSSDYDFNTIRSRQRRLEDATASSFEYYDHGGRRRSSPDEGASAPEEERVVILSPASTPPSPAPEQGPGCEEADHTDLLRRLRHTTDSVIHQSRETRVRRTPVPPSTSSDAAVAAAEVRHRPRSRAVRGGQSSARSTGGEAGRRLGALVGQHRQRHVQQLQHEIDKLGRLERLLLGGSTVELEVGDSSEDGAAAAAAADHRQGVEGCSSPSDSDPPPEPSSAYARIRETLRRRRQQIEAQLSDMDRRHRQYGRRRERFSDLAEEAGSAINSDDQGVRRRSGSRRRTATTGTGTSTGSQRRRTSSDSQRCPVSSQETTTQTSGRRRSSRASQCQLGSPGASVQVYTRRSRVQGSDAGTQTVSDGPRPAGAVQVFTRRTRVPLPADSATQSTAPHRRPASVESRRRRSAGSPRRSAGSPRRSAGSPRRSAGSPRRSAGSPRRSVTMTRHPVPRSEPPPPRRAHRAVQTVRSPERTVTVTRRRAVPDASPPTPPPSGTAVQTGGTHRRKVSGRRSDPPPPVSRRETVVRRRPVVADGSADTETISTAADTTADTTPTTVRSSLTTGEGMRDALEPSDRSGLRPEDLERAERLLEAARESTTAQHGDASVSSHSTGSLSSAGSGGRPARSPDSRRARRLLSEGVRVGELHDALWRADFCQELPSCPVSPHRDGLAGSDESRSVGTQTALLADGETYRCQTVRRQVHSEDSELLHHPPRPPAARRSVAYFLSVRRGPLVPAPAAEQRCRRVLPAVRLSQELLRQQGLAEAASDSAGGTECVREEDDSGRRVTVTQRRPAGTPSAAECISLQEALCRRRPDYIRNASVRRQYLQRLADLRRANLERAWQAAETLPELPTDADWGLFTDALRPETVRRAFDYRDMRQHTERLWRRLPEIKDCVAKRKKHAQFRTNRLMWQVYRQKLQERCLRGDLHMTHRDAVLGGV